MLARLAIAGAALLAVALTGCGSRIAPFAGRLGATRQLRAGQRRQRRTAPASQPVRRARRPAAR